METALRTTPAHAPSDPLFVERVDVNPVVLEGVAFDRVTEAQAVHWVTSAADAGTGGFVLTPNANILRQLRSADNIALAAGADLVVADGMPIIWASKITGTPLPERVTGASLIWTLSEAAARAGLPVLLIGGAPGVAERGSRVLTETYPDLSASWHFPPFGFEGDPTENEAITEAIRGTAAKIVFVGLGFPKQERLIVRLREHFPHVWFVACGAALTFVSGDLARAPGWMQHHGIEWVHRLINEPKRLARRYLVEDVPFTVAMLGRAARVRARGLAS